MRAIILRDVHTTGTKDDRDTRAYFDHLAEDMPEIGEILADMREMFRILNRKTSPADIEYDWQNPAQALNHYGFDSDEENMDFRLAVWGTACPYLHQDRSSYHEKVVRY